MLLTSPPSAPALMVHSSVARVPGKDQPNLAALANYTHVCLLLGFFSRTPLLPSMSLLCMQADAKPLSPGEKKIAANW